MNRPTNKLWQFSIAGVLALMAITAIWLGLFPTLRRIVPVIDPVFLAVLLAGACCMCAAAFLGRNRPRFRTLLFFSLVAVALVATVITQIASRH